MCIAIPMTVTQILEGNRVVVSRPGRVEEADASFSADEVKIGDTVLFFRGTILRTITSAEALKIESALECVESAMRTDRPDGVDEAFSDIIENTGKLPAHLRGLVGKKCD